MKRWRRWWVAAMVIAAFAAVFAWAHRAPAVTLRFVGFRDLQGFRAAAFALENHSRASVGYDRIGLGSGRVGLRLQKTEGWVTLGAREGGEMQWQGYAPQLLPGEKFEFVVMMDYAGPPLIREPFQVQASFSTPAPRRWFHLIEKWLPKSWRKWAQPSGREHMIWSEVVTP